MGPPGSRSPGQCPAAPRPPPSWERRGRGLPGTHLEPVVNMSPGFPSTNSSARALPSPPPTALAAEGPPSLRFPSSLRPPALPPATHQRGWAAGGGGAEGAREEGAVRAAAGSQTVRVASPSACRCPFPSSAVAGREQRLRGPPYALSIGFPIARSVTGENFFQTGNP